MSAGDEMINAAHLIVKLCDEKLALERKVADLKERNEYVMEEGHNLLDERNVLRNEKENLERDVVRLEAELKCLKINAESCDNWEAIAKRAESQFKAQQDEINQLKDALAQRQSEIERLEANDWGPLNLRIEELERERNEFQGALLRVKFALGWPPKDVEMNEDIIKSMVYRVRLYIETRNNLAFKLRQIEEIIDGSD